MSERQMLLASIHHYASVRALPLVHRKKHLQYWQSHHNDRTLEVAISVSQRNLLEIVLKAIVSWD